jgi:hypothetical protein
MRIARPLPLAALLGVALTGCGSQYDRPPDRDPKPVVATVVIHVPKMT